MTFTHITADEQQHIVTDTPLGELFIFNTPEELTEMVVMMNIPAQDLQNFGLKFVPSPDRDPSTLYGEYFSCSDEDGEMSEAEFIDGSYQIDSLQHSAFKMSVFDLNPYTQPDDGDSIVVSGHVVDHYRYLPNEVVIDPEYWTPDDFPTVAYINIQSTFDRLGEMNVFVFHTKKLSQLNTVHSIKTIIADHREDCMTTYDQLVTFDMEQRRNRRMVEQDENE